MVLPLYPSSPALGGGFAGSLWQVFRRPPGAVGMRGSLDPQGPVLGAAAGLLGVVLGCLWWWLCWVVGCARGGCYGGLHFPVGGCNVVGMEPILAPSGLPKNLRPSERMVLAVLIKNSAEDAPVAASIATLMEATGFSHMSIHRAVKRLEEEGVLTVQRRCEAGPGGSGSLPNLYSVKVPSVQEGR